MSPRVFWLLRDGNFNSDTCIAHHSTSALPSANHLLFSLPPFLTFDVEISSSRIFRFLRCFGYLGTSLHHLGFYTKNTATHPHLEVVIDFDHFTIIRPWRTYKKPSTVTSIAYISYHIDIIISSLVPQDCSRIYTIAILVCAFRIVAI